MRPLTLVEQRTAKRWLLTWKNLSHIGRGLSPLFVFLVLVGTVSSWRSYPIISSNAWNKMLFLILTVVVYLGSCGVSCRNQKQQTPKGRYIPLLFNEAFVLRHYLSPGLESRFTCSNPNTDLSLIREHLRQRVEGMVRVNPWLCGYLKTNYGIPSIWINEQQHIPTDVSRLFHEIRVEDPKDLVDALTKQTSVETGANILNTPQPFVKICLVYSPHSPDYYVTVCVMHMVGEPNLLYQLWGMLAPNAPIVPLWVDRYHRYKKHPLTALQGAARGKFLYYFFRSQASIFYMLLRGHQHPKDSPKPIMHRRYVNMEWVQAQKDIYQKKHSGREQDGPPSYISTQDVLTTWFFAQFQPSCVCVAYSLHDRVEHVTIQHMGNYLEALVLFPDEYSNPSHVRRAIASAGKWSPENNLPGSKDCSAGLITGWHSRHVDLELPYSVRQSHLPLRGAMFTGMIPRIQPCMCLFKVSRDQYAVLTLSQKELVDLSALGSPVVV